MLKKLQSDDDDLMEIFQQHYAELRRERSEYKDTVHKLQKQIDANTALEKRCKDAEAELAKMRLPKAL